MRYPCLQAAARAGAGRGPKVPRSAALVPGARWRAASGSSS